MINKTKNSKALGIGIDGLSSEMVKFMVKDGFS